MAFPEFGGPLGAPRHQMLPWRQKPKNPFSRADCQETVREPLEPTRRSSIMAWSLADYSSYRALQHPLQVRQMTGRDSLKLRMIPGLGCYILGCDQSPTHSREVKPQRPRAQQLHRIEAGIPNRTGLGGGPELAGAIACATPLAHRLEELGSSRGKSDAQTLF
jgi:hypothetical protein